jgi:acetoin:2,6-dichlorophenolindophenol oxidoreductase subunit beta
MARLRYAEALREALRAELARDSSVVLYGEDIGTYGGVFQVTRGLLEEFGSRRVRDTPISEAAMTGMTIGAAMAGLRPVLEIMYADFLPLALDMLVNQASALPFLWGPDPSLPMVIRTQGGAGVGAGAQHSKSFDGMMAHIPGLKVVSPATPADAKGLLTAAIRDPGPVVFLEHKLLYNLADDVPENDEPTPIGPARIARAGGDVSIIANARMVHEALAAATVLADDGIAAEVIDLRTLRPLDTATVLESVRRTSRAVVVNEDWRTGGFGAEVSATIAEQALEHLDAPVVRLGMRDCPIPYSQPLEAAMLPDRSQIVAAVRAMAGP